MTSVSPFGPRCTKCCSTGKPAPVEHVLGRGVEVELGQLVPGVPSWNRRRAGRYLGLDRLLAAAGRAARGAVGITADVAHRHLDVVGIVDDERGQVGCRLGPAGPQRDGALPGTGRGVGGIGECGGGQGEGGGDDGKAGQEGASGEHGSSGSGWEMITKLPPEIGG
jgi:hypothetical protein